MKNLLLLLSTLAACAAPDAIDATSAPIRAHDHVHPTTAAGYNHTCFLTGTGAVLCSGDNNYGQLGDGTLTRSFTPVTAQVERASALVAGQHHTCALTEGNVVCWGRNDGGQLGFPVGVRSTFPVFVLSGATAIAAGADHTCAITWDRTVQCWGRNAYGQLGDGSALTRTTPVLVSGLTDAVELAAGYDFTCARRASGDVKCWGSNSLGQLGRAGAGSTTPVAVSGIATATSLTAGYRHACVTPGDGSARCWGYNGRGALGDGTTTNRVTPVTVALGATRAVSLAAGYQQTCALTDGGRVACWGLSTWGSVGNGSASGAVYPTPQLLAPTSLAAVSSGPMAAHTCAARADASRLCWGWNAAGQLGDGTTTNAASPHVVGGAPLGTPIALAVGATHSCAVVAGRLVCWGANAHGQLGDGSTEDRLFPVSSAAYFTQITAASAGEQHGCLARADGTAWCWGDNTYGQLGDGTSVTLRSSPVAVSGLTGVVDVVAGAAHGCALHGDGAVSCWGNATYWQLGAADGVDSRVPRAVAGLPRMTALAAGAYHTCGLASDGHVWCWGANGYGQLGLGNMSARALPTPVGPVASAVAVAAGKLHTCAIASDGRVWCWGANASGQLGDGTTTSRTSPVAVGALASAAALAAGDAHTCAIGVEGIASCWGANGNGQLGNGTQTSSTVPVTVGFWEAPPRFLTIAAGAQHTCAATFDEVMCWGSNGSGQLGDDTGIQRLSPVRAF